MEMSASSDNDNEEFKENLENLQKKLRVNGKSLIIQRIQCFPGSSSGDNYMSIVKRIIINGISSDNEDFNMSLIIKRQIPSRSRRQLYRCDEAFTNEIAAYTYVIPMLEQPAQALPFPKCYFAGNDDNGELIILEDLKASGYRIEDRFTGLGFDHCKLVMKELAGAHAASIFQKYFNKWEFLTKRQQIKEIVYCTEADDFYRTLLESSIRESLSSLEQSNKDGSLSEPIRLIEGLQEKLYDIIRRFITKGEKNSFNVICHGDLWLNNIMFRKDSNGHVCEAKFIDLQAMRYASPVFDILHFIYTSTKRKIRDIYLKELLETYWSCLITNLDLHFLPNHINELEILKNIYSLDSITNQFYSNILYGLAVCMWVLPAVTFDPDNIPNLDEITLTDLKTSTKEMNVSQKLTPEYHSRMKDIALEFYQKGFLNLDTNF